MTVLGELLHLIGRDGYLTVFSGVMLESAGVPLPGETILIAAGALVHKGYWTLETRCSSVSSAP